MKVKVVLPLLVMHEDWEKWIEEGLASVKPSLLGVIENVAILLEDEPSKSVRETEELAADETLLGYYQGIPLTERGVDYGVGETLPDTITLYKNPIREEAAITDGDVGRVARETLWHEIGHHFGLDEVAVHKREREEFGGTNFK